VGSQPAQCWKTAAITLSLCSHGCCWARLSPVFWKSLDTGVYLHDFYSHAAWEKHLVTRNSQSNTSTSVQFCMQNSRITGLPADFLLSDESSTYCPCYESKHLSLLIIHDAYNDSFNVTIFLW